MNNKVQSRKTFKVILLAEEWIIPPESDSIVVMEDLLSSTR
jgi:hypothetical protein